METSREGAKGCSSGCGRGTNTGTGVKGLKIEEIDRMGDEEEKETKI